MNILNFKHLLFDQVDTEGGSGGVGDPSLVGNNAPEEDPYKGTWYEGIESNLYDDPSLKVFRDKEGKLDGKKLIKSYVHTKKAIGNKISVPESDDDEAWIEFNRKIGIPESLDEYKVDGVNAEDVGVEFFQDFVKTAHANGIRPKQASNMANWFKEYSEQTYQKNMETAEANTARAIEELKKEFGLGFDKKLDLAQRALATFAQGDELDHIKNLQVNQDPTMVKIFSRIAEQMGEDRLDSTVNTQKVNADNAAKELIDKVNSDMSHPYWNEGMAGHKDAVEKVQRAYSRLG